MRCRSSERSLRRPAGGATVIVGALLITIAYLGLCAAAFFVGAKTRALAQRRFAVSEKLVFSSDFYFGFRPFTSAALEAVRRHRPRCGRGRPACVLGPCWLFMAARQRRRSMAQLFMYGVILDFAVSTPVVI
jgi:hypothetical protein